MMENASFFVAERRRASMWSLPATSIWSFPARRIFEELARRRRRQRDAEGKPAVMGGFWGSHMGLIDLLLERDGNKWRVVSATSRGAADLRAEVDNKNIALVGDDKRDRRCVAGRSRGDPRLRPPPGRQDLGAALSAISRWSPTIRRCRSSARRRPGTCKELLKGTRVGGRCRSSRRPPPSRPADATAPTTIPTCRPATSRSRMSPTSTSIRTPCGRWRSPARR